MCSPYRNFLLAEPGHIVSGAGNDLDVCSLGVGLPFGLVLALLIAGMLLLILVVAISMYKAKRKQSCASIQSPRLGTFQYFNMPRSMCLTTLFPYNV